MGNKNSKSKSKDRSNSKTKNEKTQSTTNTKEPTTIDPTPQNDKEIPTKNEDENITKDKNQTPQTDTKKNDDTNGNEEPNNNKSTPKEEQTTYGSNENNEVKKDDNSNNTESKNEAASKEEQTTYDGNENEAKDDKKNQLGQLSEDLIAPNTEEEPANNDEEENIEPAKDVNNNDNKEDEMEEKKEDKIQITSIEMEDKTSYYFLNPNNLNPEYDRDVVSILALSDTLSTHTIEMIEDIPNVDILIHAGNFTQDGTLKQIEDFNEWINLLLKTKKCKYALVIAGNHEVTFDRNYYNILQNVKENGLQMDNANEVPTAEGVPDNQQEQNVVPDAEEPVDDEGADKIEDVTTGQDDMDKNDDDESDIVKKCRHTIKNAIYLEDQGIEILGLKFYGTPWSLLHNENENGNNPNNYRAFCVGTEDEMKTMFDKIPYDVDVMISHYPPYLHGDGKENVGSKKLINKLYMDVQPNMHVFGHITSCHGVTKQVNMDTTFMNVNCSNEESEMDKKPILFYLQPKLESFF